MVAKLRFWSLLLLIAMVGGATGAQVPIPIDPKAEAEFEFWSVTKRQRAAAAAEIVFGGNGLSQAMLLYCGRDYGVWGENDFLPNTVPDLNPDWLSNIKDKTPTPKIVNVDPQRLPPEVKAYLKLYDQAMINAFEVPLEKFIESAKPQRDRHVGFSQIYNSPDVYRGKVVGFKGRLIRLRPTDANAAVRAHGAPFVYEGWVMGPTKKVNPYCVLFPHLPENLQPAEDMDRDVEFYGYFIKIYRYMATDHERTTLLFIGPTLLAAGNAPRDSGANLPMPVIALIVAGIGVVVMVVVLICFSWWFKRTDQIHKVRIQEIQNRHRDIADTDLPWMQPTTAPVEAASPTEIKDQSTAFDLPKPIEGAPPGS